MPLVYRLYLLPYSFGGSGIRDTAPVLHVSPTTVMKERKALRCWRFIPLQRGRHSLHEGVALDRLERAGQGP